jgi:hypothetical protein
MATYGARFQNIPLVCHPIDSPDEIKTICESLNIDLSRIVNRYYNQVYKDYVEPLFFHSSYPMNLGGSTDRQRIITTDRSAGIFDFSLASKTLQKDVEYYSPELATEYPNRFEAMGLLSGIVPPDYVTNFPVQGVSNFIFQDRLTQKDFLCEQRQKGETEIDEGVPNARKRFKSQTKKIYKIYKRNRGKVRYVEIYSLFYYTSLSGGVQYAIRHIPAYLAAQYLESIGIQTRIYMTRFVVITNTYRLLQQDSVTKYNLPLYDMVRQRGSNPQRQNDTLFIQPFCCKDYGGELDMILGGAVAQDSANVLYQPLAGYAAQRESTQNALMGNPDWAESTYWEGFERYRNKYKMYSDLGIYRAKEVLPEGIILFHDYSIKTLLKRFSNDFQSYFDDNRIIIKGGQWGIYQHPLCNIIFSWWMKLSAIKIKHKVTLFNSNMLSKDMSMIDKDLEEIRIEAKSIQESTNDTRLKGIYEYYCDEIIDTQNMGTLQNYITAINNEITTYAQGSYFQTDDEEMEKRDEFANNINEAVINLL